MTTRSVNGKRASPPWPSPSETTVSAGCTPSAPLPVFLRGPVVRRRSRRAWATSPRTRASRRCSSVIRPAFSRTAHRNSKVNVARGLTPRKAGRDEARAIEKERITRHTLSASRDVPDRGIVGMNLSSDRLTTKLSDPALTAALSHFVRARVPEPAVEDIVQSLLTEALDAEDHPDHDEEIVRWVYGICRHKVVDWFRRARREVPRDLESPEDGPVAAAESAPQTAHDLL